MSSTSAVTQQGAVKQFYSRFNEEVAIPMGYQPMVGMPVGFGHVITGAGKFAFNVVDLVISGGGSVVPSKTLRGKCKARLPECVTGISNAVNMIARGVTEIIPGGGFYLKQRDECLKLQKQLSGLIKNYEVSLQQLTIFSTSVDEAKKQLDEKNKQIANLKLEGESGKEKFEAQKRELEEGKGKLENELKELQATLKIKTEEVDKAQDNIKTLTTENQKLAQLIPASKRGKK